MLNLRLPILTFIALALALVLKIITPGSDAQAQGRKPNSEAAEKPKAESPALPAPAAAAAAIDLKTLGASNPYEKLNKILAVKSDAIAWSEFKAALVELNISIPPISSALSTEMWKLAKAPEAAKRLSWVKTTEHVVTVNRYVEESHGVEDSTFLKANRALRAGAALDESMQKYVNNLDSALKKLPPLVGYSFRGAVLKEDAVLKDYAEGKTVTEKGFTSSSLNPSTAYAYAFPKESGFFRAVKPLADGEVRVLYVIQGKTSRPVSYFSEFWAEAEALFANGSEFAVKAISPRQDDGCRYVILEEK